MISAIKKYKALQAIATSIFIVVTLLVNLNRSFYLHSHQLENGEIVFHAHPFEKHDAGNKDTKHNHKSVEFFYLDNLNKLFIDEAPHFEITPLPADCKYIVTQQSDIHSRFHNLFYLRGPPEMI